MKFQKYEKYKDSGVDWLEEVPEKWKIKRLKDLFLMNRGKFTHRPRNDPKMYGGDSPFLQTGSVTIPNKYITEYKQTLSSLGETVSRKFPKETILMTIAANIGDVAVLSFDAYFPDSIIGFISSKNIDNNFAYYFLKILKKPLDQVKITSTQNNINLERLDVFERIIPSMQIQTQISIYLDKKTTLLDKKISFLEKKKEKYIELKQTLINKVVTKGLDRSVKMKESGIEWIGGIPEHWKVKRGKDIFFENPKSKITANDGDKKGKYKFFTSSDTQSKWLDFFEMKTESILFSTGGFAGINYCKEEYSYSTDTWSIYGNKYVYLKFYNYYFRNILHELNGLGFKGAGLEHLQKDFIKLGKIIYPSKDEQTKIANYLDEKTQKIDTIIQTINKNIETLKEFRKTLINDAVTGKIKVA